MQGLGFEHMGGDACGMQSKTNMCVDLSIGDTLRIGNVRIRLERKDGKRARILVQAPPTIKIQLPNKPDAQECVQTPQRGR